MRLENLVVTRSLFSEAAQESNLLVRYANYLSLGTVVRASGNRERVTLKSKWLCHLAPTGDVEPLEVVSFPWAMIV